MIDCEQLKSKIESAVKGAHVDVVTNDSPCGQHSLLIDREHAVEVATFLRDDAGLKLDFASNVTGVDWPERKVKDKVKVTKTVDGEEKEVDETVEHTTPAYLEAVYHLYSMEKKHGPVILRMRTGDRADDVAMPSLTPVWRSCELQEREIFDLYGIRFKRHPDLRRLLMWDEFEDHPMRKDYVDPDDFEYEPTPHGDVGKRAAAHFDGCGEGES